MKKKLSPAMQRAMDALPLEYTRWGSSTAASNFPNGVTMATINALYARDLVRIVRDGPFQRKVVKK